MRKMRLEDIRKEIGETQYQLRERMASRNYKLLCRNGGNPPAEREYIELEIRNFYRVWKEKHE